MVRRKKERLENQNKSLTIRKFPLCFSGQVFLVLQVSMYVQQNK